MNEKGVSLIESLLVVIIIGLIVFLLTNIPNALGLISKGRNLSLAREIVSKQIEQKREISYINLANGIENILDSRLSILPQGFGTVEVTDCEIQICTNGEDVKKITVIVSWKENNKNQSTKLTTFISKGGLNQ